MKQSGSMVQQLRDEAKRNQAFKDVCHMLAIRKRTRGRLTVTRLKQAMEEEGFNYSRSQYENILSFLGKLGLGVLSTSKRGKAKSLSNIKIKVQSIGAAALGQSPTLNLKREINRYEDIVSLSENVHDKQFVETATKAPEMPRIERKAKPNDVRKVSRAYPVFLTMLLDGKLVNIPGPSNITNENVGDFIAEFAVLSKSHKDSEAAS